MLTYDAGALLAAERNDRELWALHDAALRRGSIPTVPAPVFAQAWRGGPQPSLARFMKGCRVEPFSEGDARAAGAACGASHTSDIVDAAVVVSAARRHDTIVTSDPRDLSRIVDALGVPLSLHRV